jgi:16S rRNA (uracil1498-N3)-methyltransferase
VRRRFFVERFTNHTARLEGEAAHHLGRVLRAEPGQLYELSDGQSVFLARVERVARQGIEFALVEPIAAGRPCFQAAVLLSIVKFDRFEWALEKAAELGAHLIVPLTSERSERSLIAAATKRAERWKKILLESAQQARCLRPPALASPARPADAFRKTVAAMRLILSERASAPALRKVLEQSSARISRSAAVPLEMALAFGPEGGWTDQELAAAAGAGFSEASLGPNILRTETAVIAALAAAHVYFDG